MFSRPCEDVHGPGDNPLVSVGYFTTPECLQALGLAYRVLLVWCVPAVTDATFFVTYLGGRVASGE